jgi:hypothetical protein
VIKFRLGSWLVLIVAILVVSLGGCAPMKSAASVTSTLTVTPAAGAPGVTLTNPVSGQKVLAGEQILISSISTDNDGIQRVELWVDDVLVRVDVNPDVASPYVVAQPWQSDRVGTHTIIVKAFDARENEGQSQPLVIAVEAAPTPTRAMAGPSPTSVPPPSSTGAPASPSALTATLTPLAPTVTPSHIPPTPTRAPTETPEVSTPMPVCTPPLCQTGEVYYCPGDCPGGCGTQCATPSPWPTVPPPSSFKPTGIEVHPILQPVWDKPEVKDFLGYPTSTASDDRQYARQFFERGYMYWWNRPGGRGLIWVVQVPDAAAVAGFRWYGPYEDTWGGDEPFSCDAARAHAYGPRSGFGKVWCDHPDIAQAIGRPSEPERGTGQSTDYGVVQMFQAGTMLYSPLDREVWVLINGGAWQRHHR